MLATVARISPQASQVPQNTGPKSGVPSIEDELGVIDRRAVAFAEELNPVGEVSRFLVRRSAVLSVRLERCVVQESASLAARVRRALAEFRAPAGVDAGEAARLRDEVARLASFDPSPEAAAARKYEADAERGFLRVIKEIRQLNRASKALDRESHEVAVRRELASIFANRERDAEFDAMLDAIEERTDRELAQGRPKPPVGRVDVPISIGRRR